MSSLPVNETETDLERVAAAIRAHDRFVVTTHENPDGDSLGSMLAVKLALEQLGKGAVMYLSGTTPLPTEYSFMELDELVRDVPDDVEQRVLLALDCANARRIGPDAEALLERARLVVDIDHHHDNTCFGEVNAIAPEASSTGEILRDLFRALDVRLTPEIAEALYIAVVTDTGRFQYANTTPKALRLAAELVEAGANPQRVFEGVYETVDFAKLKLLARALDHATVYEGGRMVVSYLDRSDFEAAGAVEPYSEGLIDFLRAVEGAEIAALIREPPSRNGPTHRVSPQVGRRRPPAGGRLLQRGERPRDHRVHPPRVPGAGRRPLAGRALGAWRRA
jgi:phosphoesterase RecJ-like protein